MKSHSIEDSELAKDFGFDVTAPDGGIHTSAANNRLYQSKCRKIYSEFLINMRDYIFQEDNLKQELINIRRQANSPNKHNKDSNSNLSTRSASSRRTSFHTDFSDEQTRKVFPQPQIGKIDLNKTRQKTLTGIHTNAKNKESDSEESVFSLKNIKSPRNEAGNQRLKRYGSHTESRMAKCVQSSSMVEDHNAVVESISDSAGSRVIKMNPRAFSKLVCGKANVHVLNKTNGYLLRPVSESRTSSLMPKDADRSNVPERLAIVREKTNFKSPTLSHDLKVNNMLAIKKSLVGDISPRLSVGDVMLSARERRSRLFRIQLINDEITSIVPSNQKEPRRSSCISAVKTPTSTKTSSPRLTRMNLARLEQELQNRAIEKMRQTVVLMASALENRGQKEPTGKLPVKATRRVSIAPDEVSQRHFQDLPISKISTRANKFDVVDEASDSSCKFDRRLHKKTNNVHIPEQALQRPESHQRIGFDNLPVNGETSSRLRSEMSMRPVTMNGGYCSQGSSPRRRVSYHDTILYVKRSKEDDEERNEKMNRWRQRMVFAVGKK